MRLWALFCFPLRLRRPAVRDNWAGEWHYAYVVKVYDGDTITVEVLRHGRWIVQSIRLAGIDTPELRTTNPQERVAALAAHTALSDQILDKHVWLHCTGREKYGRILGEVYPVTWWFRGRGDVSYNTWLIERGHARPYHGGAKDVWFSVDL